jgi:hypothetical protein
MESEALSAQIPQPWLQFQVGTTQMPHLHDPSHHLFHVIKPTFRSFDFRVSSVCISILLFFSLSLYVNIVLDPDSYVIIVLFFL